MQSGHYYYPTDQQPATTTNTTHAYQPTLHDSGNNDSNAPVIPLTRDIGHPQAQYPPQVQYHLQAQYINPNQHQHQHPHIQSCLCINPIPTVSISGSPHSTYLTTVTTAPNAPVYPFSNIQLRIANPTLWPSYTPSPNVPSHLVVLDPSAPCRPNEDRHALPYPAAVQQQPFLPLGALQPYESYIETHDPHDPVIPQFQAATTPSAAERAWLQGPTAPPTFRDPFAIPGHSAAGSDPTTSTQHLPPPQRAWFQEPTAPPMLRDPFSMPTHSAGGSGPTTSTQHLPPPQRAWFQEPTAPPMLRDPFSMPTHSAGGSYPTASTQHLPPQLVVSGELGPQKPADMSASAFHSALRTPRRAPPMHLNPALDSNPPSRPSVGVTDEYDFLRVPDPFPFTGMHATDMRSPGSESGSSGPLYSPFSPPYSTPSPAGGLYEASPVHFGMVDANTIPGITDTFLRGFPLFSAPHPHSGTAHTAPHASGPSLPPHSRGVVAPHVGIVAKPKFKNQRSSPDIEEQRWKLSCNNPLNKLTDRILSTEWYLNDEKEPAYRRGMHLTEGLNGLNLKKGQSIFLAFLDEEQRCVFCSYRAAKSNRMVRHMRTHFGLRPYECQCPRCSSGNDGPKRFYSPEDLNDHLRTRDQVECPVLGCNRRVLENNLARHLLKQHGIDSSSHLYHL